MYHDTLPLAADPSTWLLADIGGTHARLALLDADGAWHARRTLRNAEFASLDTLLLAYLRDAGAGPVPALLAVALPVEADELRFTNRAWRMSARELALALGGRSLIVVNDFVAAAAGVAALGMADAAFTPLDDSGTPAGAVRVVLGPGTGVGVAALLDGDVPRVLPSEAGHMSFAAASDDDERLLHAARQTWGRVSWERLLCGDGLAWAAAHFGAGTRSPAQLLQDAHTGAAAACAALRWYSGALGAFAGDLCLALRATGGVVLAGGMVARLGPLLDAAAFRARFAAKGRFAARLAQVPCWRADSDTLALPGLAALRRQRVHAPGLALAGA